MQLSTKKVVTIMMGLASLDLMIGTGQLKVTAHMIPETLIPAVQDWASFLAALLTTVATVITGGSWATDTSESANAPAASKATAAPGAAAASLALAIGFTLLMCGGSASAAELKKPQITGDFVADIKANNAAAGLPADPIGSLIAKFNAAKTTVVAGAIGALQEADQDAGFVVNAATGDVRDPISHLCYPAQIKFLQSLPAAASIKSPAPFDLIVAFQLKRDMVAQIRAGIPAYLTASCAALLGDEIKVFIATAALAGVTIAAPELAGVFPVAAAGISLPGAAALLVP